MNENVKEFIEHHGVKGMHWGVRRAAQKAEKADNKFIKKSTSISTIVKVHNAAAIKTNAFDVDRINNKPEYKNLNVYEMGANHPLVKKYYKEHAAAMEKRLNDASAEIIGTSKSGKYSVKFSVDPTNLAQSYMIVDHSEVKHADDNQFIIKLEFDDKGKITKFVIPNESFQQAVDFTNSILEHHGVKGMRWGVRRARGSDHTQSDDSKQISELRKRKPHQLTNAELKSVNERMNLEQNFRRMNPGPAKAGKEIAAGILATVGIGITAYNMIHSPAGQALSDVGKRVVKRVIKR